MQAVLALPIAAWAAIMLADSSAVQAVGSARGGVSAAQAVYCANANNSAVTVSAAETALQRVNSAAYQAVSAPAVAETA